MCYIDDMYNSLELSLLQRCGYSMEPSPNTSIEATFTPDGQYVVSGICLLHYLLWTDISIYIFMYSNCHFLPSSQGSGDGNLHAWSINRRNEVSISLNPAYDEGLDASHESR